MVDSKAIKAKELVRSGKVKIDLETEKRIYFTVESNEKHSVIYDKLGDNWECDCRYFSLKGKECSHILACKIYLKSKAITKE